MFAQNLNKTASGENKARVPTDDIKLNNNKIETMNIYPDVWTLCGF